MNFSKLQKRAIESLYHHTCTIIEEVQEKDEIKKVFRPISREVYKDIPCRLSSLTQNAKKEELIASAKNRAKLFLSNEVQIKEGSKVIVNAYGRTLECSLSSVAFFYSTHQEIEVLIQKEVL